jgi:CMP-N-acetylneuraminic acid synthetase
VLRRQDKPELYARNGPAVLIVRPDLVRNGQLYGDPNVGYVMSALDSVDVDGPEDLRLAELLLQARPATRPA